MAVDTVVITVTGADHARRVVLGGQLTLAVVGAQGLTLTHVLNVAAGTSPGIVAFTDTVVASSMTVTVNWIALLPLTERTTQTLGADTAELGRVTDLRGGAASLTLALCAACLAEPSIVTHADVVDTVSTAIAVGRAVGVAGSRAFLDMS